jgi:hypothetical protein
MEIIDLVDIYFLRLGIRKTPNDLMDKVDKASEDLKSPGGNTVWVRPPPALSYLRCLGVLSRKTRNYRGIRHKKKESAVMFNQNETQGIVTNSFIDDYLLT